MYIKLSWERSQSKVLFIFVHKQLRFMFKQRNSWVRSVIYHCAIVCVRWCKKGNLLPLATHTYTQDNTHLHVYVLLQIDTGIQVCVPWSYYINIDWLLFINKRGWLIHIHYPLGCYIITTKLWSNIPFPITWRRSFPPPMHEEIAFSIMCFWQVQCLSMCLRECVSIVVYTYTILMYL